MATKVAVKRTYNLNNKQTWWQDSLTSSDPAWNSNYASWKTDFLQYLDDHSFASNESVKLKYEFPDSNTLVTTYMVEGATAENIQSLIRVFLLSHPLKECFDWKHRVFDADRGITLTEEVVTTVDV